MGQVSASSVLQSLQTETVEGEHSRLESHSHASSSNGSGKGFYEGAGPGDVEVARERLDPFSTEISMCEEIDDILEIVAEEADGMTGTNLAAALKR